MFLAASCLGQKQPRRGNLFVALARRYDLLEDGESSSVLASWPQHLRQFAGRVFHAALL